MKAYVNVIFINYGVILNRTETKALTYYVKLSKIVFRLFSAPFLPSLLQYFMS